MDFTWTARPATMRLRICRARAKKAKCWSRDEANWLELCAAIGLGFRCCTWMRCMRSRAFAVDR